MAEDFESFDLTVLFAGNPAGIWLSATSQLGSVQAVPRRDPTLYPLDALNNDAAWFREAIDKGLPVRDQGAEFGGLLRDLVFGVDEIATLFRRTRGAASAAGRPLLVRLLAAPEEVAALPWELLVDPEGDAPLLFAPDVHLVRLARDRRYSLRLAPIAPPLNVLLVLSNPSDPRAEDVPFDHYEEGRALIAELRELIDRGVLLVDVEDCPSIENLRRRIGSRERGYHVVHYLGHAMPDKLKLETSSGAPSWIPSEKFNALLRMCPDLRLTFFAGCRTASLARGAAPTEFAGQLSVADRCVRDACQNVLGMHAVLPFRTEQMLTRFFYQALCTGTTIVRALSLARSAVRDDEELGRDLLNWAVPSLVTGHLPSTLVDPLATPATVPKPKPRRAQLKLELAEPDREFFARFAQLREALTVLCRRGPNRVVWVTGAPGAGKSRLLARALDELDESIVAVLYVTALRLARDGDPVEKLCELVTELLNRASRQAPERNPAWKSPGEWWDRLIEELIDTPFILAIDDIDLVDESAARKLGIAIDRLVLRVSQARVALAGGDAIRPGVLSGDTEPLLSKVHVLTLEPGEVIQWVRRNRPALATALGPVPPSDLSSIHNKLGFKLHLWSRLAEELERQDVKDVMAAVDSVLSCQAPYPVVQIAGALTTSTGDSPQAVPTGPGPLRVAAAGPFTSGRQQQFADSIGALALEYGAGARVVVEGAPDAGTAVAQLLPIESPFPAEGTTTSAAILRWLKQLIELKPNIVLLDYGASKPALREEKALRELADGGALLIAAAGNSGEPTWPAWHDFVLAVGAHGRSNRLERYSKFFPEARKPDLFALGVVEGSPMDGVPDLNGASGRGTSFAALNAVAAAVLVWSVDRTMTSVQVAELLRVTASPIGKGPQPPRRLDLGWALDSARLRLVAGSLTTGPLDEQAITAASGLGREVAGPLLKRLVDRGDVKHEGERYVGDAEKLASVLT